MAKLESIVRDGDRMSYTFFDSKGTWHCSIVSSTGFRDMDGVQILVHPAFMDYSLGDRVKFVNTILGETEEVKAYLKIVAHIESIIMHAVNKKSLSASNLNFLRHVVWQVVDGTPDKFIIDNDDLQEYVLREAIRISLAATGREIQGVTCSGGFTYIDE
jgi:hypothetical protein